MQPINHRSDLVAYLARRAPSVACQRAMSDDRTTVLGGFTPPGGFPRWIVKVLSPYGRTWYLALLVDEDNRRYVVEYPREIRWAHWTGSGKRHPLYDGDTPHLFLQYRREGRIDRTT